MNSSGWVRARSDDQIRERTSALLEATARLYEDHRFEEITLTMIAREAGFTRSNLYRYFATKEELFLDLVKSDLSAWRSQIEELVRSGRMTVEEFAAGWIDLQLDNPRLMRLFSLLYTTLEPNATLETLVELKKHTAREITLVAQAILTALPGMTPEAAGEFLFVQTSLAIGAYPVIAMTEKQRVAMERAGGSIDPAVYRAMLIHTLEITLRGLLQESGNSRSR